MMAGMSGGKMPKGLDQMLGNGFGGQMGKKALQGMAKSQQRKKKKRMKKEKKAKVVRSSIKATFRAHSDYNT